MKHHTINTEWNIAYGIRFTCMLTKHQKKLTVNVLVCLFCTAVHSYIFSKHCCHLIFLYRLTYAFEINKKQALTYAFHCVICPLFLFKRAEAVERIGKPLFQRALPRQETSSSVRRCLSQTSQLTALMSLSTNLWHNSKQAMEVQSRHICDRCKLSLTLSQWPW